MAPQGNRYRDDETVRARSRLAVAAFVLAIAAGLVIVLAGPGSRLGLWDFRTGFTLLKYGTWMALGGAGLGLLGALRSRPIGPRRGIGFAALAIVIGLAAAYGPWTFRRQAQSVPPIHDITTDTTNPPAFVDVLPLRAEAPNSADYEGDEIARQQREAYPDIRPLEVEEPPERAFARALRAAREMGWEIVAAEPDEGRIEATATTFWFGFKDDVVVRVRPAPGGSRIDVRSVSRVGRSDVGANARRIRDYMQKLQAS